MTRFGNFSMPIRGVTTSGGGGLAGSFKNLPRWNIQAFRDAFESVHPDIGRIVPLDGLNVFVFDVTDLRELCLCQPSFVS